TLLAAGMMGNESPVRLAGGAAGDDLAMQTTHVGMGSRIAADAVVIAAIFSKKPLGIGVCHGHAPLSEDSVTVTKAEGATVYELDGRPAWDVWKEKTSAAAAADGVDVESIPASEIGGFLLRYEGGLANGSQFKIRAPLSLGDDGSLSFACGIPEGAVVRITESTPERQVVSAVTAAERARAQLESEPAGAIVFDCICRNLILGQKFADAVSGVSKALGSAPVAGFETYGEIALDAGDMSGFHNTTTVVLAFPS
ncbi:MAG: FIST C-terminal domain-containing protein, partial [Myxococcota bacterium]